MLYDELKDMRKACGRAHMKAILAVGELGSMENVYKASMVAMMAGSDFIKTSTGKEGVNATLVNALVMVRAIREYQRVSGFKVGFKPAGKFIKINFSVTKSLILILIKVEFVRLKTQWCGLS